MQQGLTGVNNWTDLHVRVSHINRIQALKISDKRMKD